MADKVVTSQRFILRVIDLGYKFIVLIFWVDIKSNKWFSNGLK